MSESDSLLRQSTSTSVCSNCRKGNSVDIIYVCASGHEICSSCNSRLTRCLLCNKTISDSPFFYCKYNHLGCTSKAILDEVREHQTDCDFKEFGCPFQIDGCNWYDCEKNLVQHLKEFHNEDVLMKNIVEEDLPRKDRNWVFIGFNKVFKCYVWIYEFNMDWVVKYMGPQKYSNNYSYEVKLYRPDGITLYKESSRCAGYNNISIEECVTLSVKNITEFIKNGMVRFKIKVFKNIPSVADVR